MLPPATKIIAKIFETESKLELYSTQILLEAFPLVTYPSAQVCQEFGLFELHKSQLSTAQLTINKFTVLSQMG